MLSNTGKADRSTAKVRAVLARIHRARRFIGVQFDGEARIHQSLILSVDGDDFVIDELFAAGDAVPPPGSECTVTTQDRGISVSFATRVVAPPPTRTDCDYRLALPASIDRNERRNAFRVKLGGRGGYKVEIRSPNHDDAWEAMIRDLSTTGVRLEIPKVIADALIEGARVDGCRFQIPDTLPFECGLEIRRLEEPDGPRPIVMLGAQFIDLPTDSRRALERVLMREERERRRRGALFE